ncbi:MAG: methylated-DNA--[protein]-cysteine S-methyltransferase, partial [Alcanivorax sp.]|nr:methylated-DNA--[protein]-cysteine S-methyltransferase [Alcanivorax sp.]
HIGLTPFQYARAHRRQRLRQALPGSERVLDVALAAGYGSASRFYEDRADILGMPAHRYRRGGSGEFIIYTFAPSSLGQLLVAASDKGLCAISLGDDRPALLHALQAQFPQAQLEQNHDHLGDSLQQVLSLLDRPSTRLSLPLDIRGTAFQQRVWDALQALPVGSTISYQQLAQQLGMPRGSRAVARACAANRLALVIPCHRVVRKDGALAGYRWGSERKRALLAREQRHHED